MRVRASAARGLAVAAGLIAASAASVGQAAEPPPGLIGGAAYVNSGGLFSRPSDVAVYTGADADPANDKILVAEAADAYQYGVDQPGSSRIQRLGRDGRFELAWGRDVVRAGAPGDTGTGYEVCRVAVSGSDGCKQGEEGADAGELNHPTGVAVDQSTGHVYVSDRYNRRIQEFDLDGRFVRAWGWGVDTGAAEFEICKTSCLGGRLDRREGNGNVGQFGLASPAALAVSPAPPHDVLATDGSNHRVMQFESDGDFRRAWGHGVDTGAERMEACTAESGCQVGSDKPKETHFARSSWPRHIAVDADGIVYASDSSDDNRLVRFDSDPAPRSGDASDAIRDPLSARLIGDGATGGLDLDPVTGRLYVIRDASEGALTLVQEIRDPGVERSSGVPGAAVAMSYAIPDAWNVEGLGAGHAGEALYVAASIYVAPGSPTAVPGCPAARLPVAMGSSWCQSRAARSTESSVRRRR
jgi:DNA-binding beta-propeller fold protein YncE